MTSSRIRVRLLQVRDRTRASELEQFIMKSINTKRFAVNLTTASLLFALIVSCSYVSLANVNKPVGEILISGTSTLNGKSVTVNGEAATTGRTLFDSSVVSTPEGQSAVINLGKAGKVQLAPGSTVTIGVNGEVISGNLSDGSLTVLGSLNPVNITTKSGDSVPVSSGESVTSASTAASKAQTGPGGVNWWVWAAIVAGAAVAVVLIVTNDDDNVTSPVR